MRGDPDRDPERRQRRASLPGGEPERAEPQPVGRAGTGALTPRPRGRDVGLDPAVAHRDHPWHPGGDRLVVGDHHDRRALVVQGVEELQHRPARRRVEVAGRLVGEQDPRSVHERPGHGDPLALAARQLARRVVERGPRAPLGAAPRPPGGAARGAGRPGRAGRRRRSRAPSVARAGRTAGRRSPGGRRASATAWRRSTSSGRRRPARTPPVVGRSSAPMMLSRVDLPDPDGPTTARYSPSSTVRSTSCSTVRAAGPVP